MYILKIIPIASGLPENYFSYFSKENINLGSLVKIKIKNRNLFGIVSESNDVKNEKINIKGEKFSLKKIETIANENFIDEALFKSLKEIAILNGCDEGDILSSFIPNFLLENNILLNKINIKKTQKIKTFLILNSIEERIKEFQKIIKENIKNKNSTCIFFPTINDLESLKKNFSQDFKEKIISFHSGQNEKEQKENIEKLKTVDSFIILSTPSLLPFISREIINLKTIILEKENSFNYFTHGAKKQIDFREIAKKISDDLGLELVVAGASFSLSTFSKIKIETDLKISTKEEDIFKIVERANEKESLLEKEEYKKYNKIHFSEELIKKLEELKNKREGKIFLYTKRKGLFTEMVCSDCSHILKCQTCDKPYILTEKKDIRFASCPTCKIKIELVKDKNLLCEKCGSWRMSTIGIGTEGVDKNLKEIGFKTFILDSQNIKTKNKAKEIIEKWRKEKLSILIGTDLALNFLNNEEIDLSAVISIDSLFSIPELNIDEKIINLFLEIKDKLKSKEKVLIQTRVPDSDIWQFIKSKNIKDFLERELENRKILNLPPFSKILRWKIDNKNLKLKNDLEKIIQKIFKEENVENIKITSWEENKTKKLVNMMILKNEDWQKEVEKKYSPTHLAKKLTYLLSDFKLEINPPNIYS